MLIRVLQRNELIERMCVWREREGRRGRKVGRECEGEGEGKEGKGIETEILEWLTGHSPPGKAKNLVVVRSTRQMSQ